MKCIELTKGKVAIVDDGDFERIAQWRWHVDKNGYAVRKNYNADGTKTHILMHRVVLNAAKGIIIDHKNRDVRDNRKENLRICTTGQNIANSKVHKNNLLQVKGVTFSKTAKSRPYRAQIRYSNKTRHLGCFGTAEEAHEAYCKAATAAHGEFARFN